jgi:hypothetical protein
MQFPDSLKNVKTTTVGDTHYILLEDKRGGGSGGIFAKAITKNEIDTLVANGTIGNVLNNATQILDNTTTYENDSRMVTEMFIYSDQDTGIIRVAVLTDPNSGAGGSKIHIGQITHNNGAIQYTACTTSPLVFNKQILQLIPVAGTRAEINITKDSDGRFEGNGH